MDAKEPRPKVKLTGTDGNAFMIIGGCLRVLKAAKLYNEHETKVSWFSCLLYGKREVRIVKTVFPNESSIQGFY